MKKSIIFSFFKRTEHFYDDEDARKIAESYGLKDKKEDGKHGLKDDDRKYHVSLSLFTPTLFLAASEKISTATI